MLTKTKTTKMNFDEFCNNLNLISEYFDWKIDPSTFSVRCYKNNRLFCPITAVAYVLLNKFYTVDKWKIAANKLNLNRYHANLIMQAADCGVLYNGETQECYDKIITEICK